MTKSTPTSKQPLVSSWQLLRPSIELGRVHMYSLLWLLIFPAILSNVASLLVSNALTRHGVDTKNASFSAISDALTVDSSGQIAIFLSVLSLLWLLFAYPAGIVLATRAVRLAPDQTDLATSLRMGLRHFWRLYGLVIVTTLLIGVGFLLLIVPGLYMLRRYILAPYYLVANDSGVFEAMRQSAKESKPYAGYIWGTLGVALVIELLVSLVAQIPVAGLLIGPIVGIVFFFGFSLRQREINTALSPPSEPKATNDGKKQADRHRAS